MPQLKSSKGTKKYWMRVLEQPGTQRLNACFRQPTQSVRPPRYGRGNPFIFFFFRRMFMSDQRWSTCCTLSDGEHNNNLETSRFTLLYSSAPATHSCPHRLNALFGNIQCVRLFILNRCRSPRSCSEWYHVDELLCCFLRFYLLLM